MDKQVGVKRVMRWRLVKVYLLSKVVKMSLWRTVARFYY
jgi:hypothetical protein